MTDLARAAPAWHLFVPKLVTTLRQGYGVADFRHDAIAGLTVAIVALPLAIASGTTPANGLVTAVVAGFLISALGGSRFQIGGPTGAFVVVVYGVIAKHGYDGMVLATLMAGAMLMVAGLARVGTWIKYIPEPVVTGFTSGIAVITFSSQVKDLLGLDMGAVPADFFDKWAAFWDARGSVGVAAPALSPGAHAVILVLRRVAPRAPGFLLAIILTAVVVTLAGLPVDTIGSRFGGIEAGLPMPSLPAVSLGRVRDLLPSAFTIAFLAGVESLLSAVVAWNMSEMARFRHLLRGPAGDRVVLLVTFGLTVAIEVGVVLASILFMHRMSEVAAIGAGGPVVEMDEDDFARVPGDAYSQRDALPRGVEVFQLRGPLFFGVAGRLSDVIDNVGGAPRVFILRMREVPMVDATGASRLKDFVARAERHGTQVIFSGLQRQPAEVLRQMGVMDGAAHLHLAADFAAAVALARRLVAG